MSFKFRQAGLNDLDHISWFTDYWLSGRGKDKGEPGAVNDCFVSPSQHKKYITRYKTYLVLDLNHIIAWAVVQLDGSLIHFLVAGDCRLKGIGTWFLKKINPPTVRSKLDQSSGDPSPFYAKNGYRKTVTIKSQSRFDIDKIRPHRKKNIDIYQKIT